MDFIHRLVSHQAMGKIHKHNSFKLFMLAIVNIELISKPLNI
jgi:hypothetical protein